jgi:hypothetical protein
MSPPAAAMWRSMINMKLSSALLRLIRHLKDPISKRYCGKEETEKLEDLCRRWFTEQEAREQVSALLREHNLDESAIEAEVFREAAVELELVDRMQSSMEARRNKAIACLAACRASLTMQPRGELEASSAGKLG